MKAPQEHFRSGSLGGDGRNILRLLLIGLAAWAIIPNGTSAEQTPVRVLSIVPIRGLHLSAPGRNDLPAVLEFIRTVLPKEGVNTLVIEFNYRFDFQSRPEFADPSALGKAAMQQIVKFCRDIGVQLIPQFNCLGHQSWAKRNARLLEKHPEFDETPGKYPNNEGIYCRSYCPLHPDVHKVLFDLIDELAAASQAKAFHIGMDEVFILADPDCPRCKGRDPARVLAEEVKTLHAHLKGIGCRTWMWGDRFIDGKATGLGKWEASENGTQSAIDLVPRDIVICDWHYEKAPATPLFFAQKGFDVVASPWRKPAVALAQLAQIQDIRNSADSESARHALGVMQTTWCGFRAFTEACQAQKGGVAPEKNGAAEPARCFTTLFNAIREGKR